MDPLYGFLKDYLDLSLKKNSRKGATYWALMVAIAAIGWYVLTNVHPSDMYNVWRIVSFFAPCALLLNFFLEMSRWGTPRKRNSYRILRLGATAGINRQQSLSFFIFWGAVLVSYCYFYRHVHLIPLIGGAVFPFLFCAAGLVNFIDNIGKEFAVESAEIESSGILIFLTLLVLASAVCLCLVFVESSSSLLSASHIEWQLALAIVVCAGLAFQLISEGKDDLKFTAIELIWIEYSIGEVGADEAKANLRQIIHGARIDEVLGSYIARYQGAYTKAAAVAESIKKLQAAIHTDGEPLSKQFLDLSKSALPGLRTQLGNEIRSCETVLAEIKRMISKYNNDAFKRDALLMHDDMFLKLGELKVLTTAT